MTRKNNSRCSAPVTRDGRIFSTLGRALLPLATLVLALGSFSALAEEKVIHEADRTIYRKKTVVDFSEVNVEGELTKPEGSYVLDRQSTSFPSRIKVRSSFVPELEKSVDNL